jgi:hypothetical protein
MVAPEDPNQGLHLTDKGRLWCELQESLEAA